MKKLIAVARITKPHGIRGAVYVASFCQPPENILRYTPLYFESGDKVNVVSLKATARADFFIATLKGSTDRNAAEALRNQNLCVLREQFPEAEDDTFYYEDLVGLLAYDEDNVSLGVVTSVVNYGAQDIVVVTTTQGQERLVPFLKSVSVDIEKKTMIIPKTLLMGEGND